MQVELKVPVLPESVTEGTLGEWHKKIGDTIAVDENVLVSSSELSVEGQGEVGPFIGGNFFGRLDLGDTSDPAGDDAVSEVTIVKL